MRCDERLSYRLIELIQNTNKDGGIQGETIASGSWDGMINIWDVDTAICIRTLLGHSGWVLTLLALEDGSLASGSTDKTLRVWNRPGDRSSESSSHAGRCVARLEMSTVVRQLLRLRNGSVALVLEYPRRSTVQVVNVLK